MPTTPLDKFQSLLKSLFLYDAADLDFGIYRVLNARRQDIEQFVDNRLPQIVSDAFAQTVSVDRAKLEEQRDKLNAQLRESLPGIAYDAGGEFKPEFLESSTGREYTDAQQKLDAAKVTDELISRVYGDLFTFFNRYWDDGDFISARRRGRGENYAVPYNGEEVLLHWANRDQYYIKTGERFTTYRFNVEGSQVSVELRGASVANNNNKTEKRYFALADTDAVAYDAGKGVLTIALVYRALTGGETEQYGKTENSRPQDKLNEAMEIAILDAITDPTLKAALAAPMEPGGHSRLRKRIATYTRKNSSDFFIHKDLKGFLRRELDFFLKNDVLLLDELLHEANRDPAPYLRRARATQAVAGQVIDFLAQLENFQKRLFLKKKFVVSTHYAVTLHHVPDELMPAVVANPKQLEDWERLYGLSELMAREGLLNGGVDAHIKAQFPALMMDTRHFGEDFAAKLLAGIDDLDAQTDGVLFQSENLQALRLMAATYRERVKCIYIDPPYNTGNDGFLYKDAFQHSSWLSMMQDRLAEAQALLATDGALFAQIDDKEVANLKYSLDGAMLSENFRNAVIVRRGIKNVQSQFENISALSVGHDTIYVYTKSSSTRLPKLMRYSEEAEAGKWDTYWRGTDRPTMRYEIFGQAPSIGQWRWGEQRAKKAKSNYEQFSQNVAGTKSLDEYFVEHYEEFGEELDFLRLNDDGVVQYYVSPRDFKLLSDVWLHVPTRGSFTEFPTEKHTDLLELLTGWVCSSSDMVLDFFGGSGTTGHAVVNLNRTDNGKRKYVLCEMGEYFDTVLLPRLKKAVFTDSWRDGKAQTANGIRHLIRYHALEQYEDTLSGVERPRAEAGQTALELYADDYLLRYWLDYETAGSPTLLSVPGLSEPSRYKLRISQDGTPTEPTIDLQATFHFLLGLQVGRLRQYRDGERVYRASLGMAGAQRVAIVWRDLPETETNETTLANDRAFLEQTVLPDLTRDTGAYDRLFLNGAFTVAGAEAVEPEFMRLMWPEETA